MAEWVGYWEIDAPVSKEEQEADLQLLMTISVPDEVTLKEVSVWVHGREWHWQKHDASGFR